MKTFNRNKNDESRNQDCIIRPKYHFLAPSNWMNDPNGPIFHNGEYHIFYQYNPTGNEWGNIHWGHAKSKDLVYWEHLPIALSPSHEKGENHCFSGCCVINHEIPTIIYTSIGENKDPSNESETWLAYSDDNMIVWEKYDKNPIVTKSLHAALEVQDWRDPFIWKEKDYWYMVLGGHIKEPIQPLVLLYQSHDLFKWKFLKPLCIEDKSKGKNWECPNFFELDGKSILIVSPHNRVIYTIGSYNENEFKPNQWHILDHGKLYYATNGMKDKDNRLILWAWINAKGLKNWNGCLSLPRILSLAGDCKLHYHFPSEFNKLREKKFCIKSANLINQSISYPFEFQNFCFEIEADIQQLGADLLYFKMTDNDTLRKKDSIGYDIKNKVFWAGSDKIYHIPPNNEGRLKFHIYIDISIVEVIINSEECLTAQIIPLDSALNKLELVVDNGGINVNKLTIWNLKSIW